MKVIITGVGKSGTSLVKDLLREKHNVTVIDSDQKVVQYIVDRYDVSGIVGSGYEKSTLLSAGVENADLLVATTPSDEVNILCCIISKKLDVKHTVARVRDPKYFSQMTEIREELGIDYIFNPDYYVAESICNVLRFPFAKEVDVFAGGKVTLVKVDIEEKNPLINKSMAGINREYKSGVLFALVLREGKTVVPHGDFVINEGDSVYILATDTEITNFFRKLHSYKQKTKLAFIAGGGRTTHYLTEFLSEYSVKVKIIESDKSKAEELASTFPTADVCFGDATDSEILSDEGIADFDAFVALTDKDEENIVISMYATDLDIKKVVTKVESPFFYGIEKRFDLDTVVSPQDVSVNHVLKLVRSYQALSYGNISALFKFGGDCEIVEFKVGKDFQGIGIPIRNLKVKNDVLIGGVVRDGEFNVATGETTIEKGDSVLIVTESGLITDINQILK